MKEEFIPGGYPYTYACDYVRLAIRSNEDGTCRLSRSDAYALICLISESIGSAPEHTARLLAASYCLEAGITIPEESVGDF